MKIMNKTILYLLVGLISIFCICCEKEPKSDEVLDISSILLSDNIDKRIKLENTMLDSLTKIMEGHTTNKINNGELITLLNNNIKNWSDEINALNKDMLIINKYTLAGLRFPNIRPPVPPPCNMNPAKCFPFPNQLLMPDIDGFNHSIKLIDPINNDTLFDSETNKISSNSFRFSRFKPKTDLPDFGDLIVTVKKDGKFIHEMKVEDLGILR